MRKYLLITAWSGIFALLWITASFARFFDFENQGQFDQWEVLTPLDDRQNAEGGSWQIINGTLKFKSGWWDWWDFLVLKNFEFTDGTIQYKLKWIKGEHCNVGVFYRLVEESPDLPHYHVHASAEIFPGKDSSGVVWGYIEKVVDRVTDEIAAAKWPELDDAQIPGWERTPVDKWFEFKIEVSGEKHVVYAGLEGKLERVIEFRHDGPRSGKVGLVNLNGVDTVLIDDFEVIPGAVAVDRRSKLTTIWGKIKSNQ